MLSLLRLFAYAAASYLFFLTAYPHWQGQTYHVASLSVVAGAAVGVWLFLKLLDLGESFVKLIVELAFACAVALYFGYTLPQRGGKAPLEQWAAGKRPTQSEAREGLTRLGLDPNGSPGKALVSLFPKS